MAALTRIRIRNFKAVGDEPIELRLAPITLLYGPNGAGKSTILHALQYAREILERGNLDPDRTLAGGDLDLGGFLNLVHGRHAGSEIRIGFDLDLGGEGMPDFEDIDDERDQLELHGSVDLRLLGDLRRVTEATLDLVIAYRPGFDPSPYVRRWEVGIGGHGFAAIESSADLRSVLLSDFNEEHPLISGEISEASQDEEGPPGLTLADVLFRGKPVPLLGVYGTAGALPGLDRKLSLDLDISAIEEAADIADEYPPADLPPHYMEEIDRERRLNAAIEIYVSRILVGTGRLVRDALRHLLHVGPLREVPPRGYRPQRTVDPARWMNGLAAWDRLAAMTEKEVEAIGAWLDERLGSGFSIRLERTRTISSRGPLAAVMNRGATVDDLETLGREWSAAPETRRILLEDRINGVDVEPPDVGVGVSQLLPVVVAARDFDAPFVAVEQPELHVHPRLQTELGDLFGAAVGPVIEQASLFEEYPATLTANGRTLLIETHSEHLVLRLLRRIRERNEGTLDPDAPLMAPELLSINYVEPHEDGARLHRLRVDHTGEFLDRWPEGFFAEREDELF